MSVVDHKKVFEEAAKDTMLLALPMPADALGDAGKSRALSDVLELKNLKVEGKMRRALPIMKRAVRKINENEYKEAARLGLQALDIDENIALANHITAIAIDKLGVASLALEMYERAQRLDPNEPEVYQNLGLLAWRMDLLDIAEQFFRIFCRMMPDSFEGPNNLACVLRDKGMMEDAIEVLRSAIYTNENSSLLWNSLGTVMMEQTNFENAMLFYRQALEIQPDLARAYHNMAYCRSTEGKHAEAFELSSQAIDMGGMPPHEVAESRHARAISLIGLGRLEEAWEAYDCRLDPQYNKATCYSIPRPKWDGEDIEGKNILVIGEQGLGDEVMFLNMGHDLIDRVGPEGHVTFAVVPRLVPLMERSFPKASVTRHATVRSNGLPLRGCPTFTKWSEVDFWAPMATMLRLMRSSIEAYPSTPGYLTPDAARVEHWRGELSKLGPGFKCGLLWKSMLMSAKRSKYYSPFEQWKSTLNLDGITWINLQYGDCEEDLKRAHDEFGAKVHQLEGIDLKDNLDDLAALCVALDMVIGPMNATTNIASASGANSTIITGPHSWPLLGTDGLPWYPSATAVAPDTISDWKPAMARLNAHLLAEAAKYEAEAVRGAA